MVAIGLSLALGACASKPKPVLEEPAPIVEAKPAPRVVEAPAPAPAPVAAPVQTAVGPVAGSVEDFRVNVGDRVYFGYDSFELSGDARATLDRQAAFLRTYGETRILIAGNADERGTREYNLALGARRAASAKAYLVSLGVSADRIETVSYGKERPIDPRSNEEAWATNRNAWSSIVSGAIG
jgi:peptidoglycan-associated lipoprotein